MNRGERIEKIETRGEDRVKWDEERRSWRVERGERIVESGTWRGSWEKIVGSETRGEDRG